MSWWIAAQLLRVALTNIALALHTYDPINVLHYIGMAIYTYALHNDGRYYESCLYTCLPQLHYTGPSPYRAMNTQGDSCIGPWLYRAIPTSGHNYIGPQLNQATRGRTMNSHDCMWP